MFFPNHLGLNDLVRRSTSGKVRQFSASINVDIEMRKKTVLGFPIFLAVSVFRFAISVFPSVFRCLVMPPVTRRLILLKNYSHDYRQNCSPFSPITIANHQGTLGTRLVSRSVKTFFDSVPFATFIIRIYHEMFRLFDK